MQHTSQPVGPYREQAYQLSRYVPPRTITACCLERLFMVNDALLDSGMAETLHVTA